MRDEAGARVTGWGVPLTVRRVAPPRGEEMVTEVTLPSVQVKDSSKPPRARRPLTDPDCHWSGRAGSRVILPGSAGSGIEQIGIGSSPFAPVGAAVIVGADIAQ